MADNIQAVGIELDAREYQRQLERAIRKIEELEDRFDSSVKKSKQQEDAFGGLAKKVLGLAAAYGAFRALDSAKDFIFATNVEFQKLEATLATVTGGVREGAAAFQLITDFAKTTPFEVSNLTDSFIQLRARGLSPTEERLRGLGNFASAFTRDITELTNAIISGASGMSIPLRRFGLDAAREGDKITLTFGNVTRTVDATVEAISGFIAEVGNTRFADAMSARMNTLDGAISNLKDSSALLAKQIGDAGLNGEINQLVRTLDQAIQDSDGFAKVLGETLAGGLHVANVALELFIRHQGLIITGFEVLTGAAVARGMVALIMHMKNATRAASGLAAVMALAGGWPGLIAAAGGALAFALVPKLLRARVEAEGLGRAFGELTTKELDAEISRLERDIAADEALKSKLGGVTTPDMDIRFELNRGLLDEARRKRRELETPITPPSTGGGTGDEVAKVVQRLNEERDALRMNERQLLGYTLAQMGASEVVREHALMLFDEVTALEADKKAREEAERQAKQNAEAVASVLEQLELQNLELTKGEEAVLRHTLATKDATRAQIEQAIALHRKNKELEDAREAEEKVREKAQREAQARIDAAAEQLRTTSDRMAGEVSDAFIDIITGTEDVEKAFASMVDGIIRELARLLAQRAITEPLAEFFLSLIGGALGGGGGQIGTGGLTFGGRGKLHGPLPRAAGGPVDPGRSFVVGEQGPELFVPSSSGQIVPNGQLGGGQVIVHQAINIPVNAVDARDAARFVREQKGEIARVVLEATRESQTFARSLRR